MRIISGSCRGRKLISIQGRQIRPTTDRTREAVFNIISSRVRHASVLDLFAGTGAFGIEALSRGAGHAVFADQNCDILRQNLEICRLKNLARIIECDLLKQGPNKDISKGIYDIIFMDPPYGRGLIDTLLEREDIFNILSDDGIIIAEHGAKEKIMAGHPGLDIFRQKKYSQTMISFIHKI